MKNLHYYFLIFLSTFSLAQSQTNLINGRVLDKNNFPLPGAIIQIQESTDVSVSDFNGYFTMMTESASVNVKITYMGFENYEEELEFPLESSGAKIFVLTPSVNELSEVIVSGFQSGIVKAMNKQKSDVNVTNIVSSDQTGKFPDSNIGDAIKRIPGVMMQNDQGEARDIVIRGISPALNSVTINGERMPSAEGDNRRVQMDLIPTDMIQMIEVNKTVTPDMEGDAIGGSVNLVTRSNPNAFRFVANTSYGTNPIRENGQNYNISTIISDKVSPKFSYSLSASTYTNDYGSDNVENEFESERELQIVEQQVRRYDVKRTRRSVSLNLDYNFDANNVIYIKSLYNHRDDWENRYKLKIDDIDEEADGTLRVKRETKAGGPGNDFTRLEDQKAYKYALGGDHQLGKLKMDWKYSYARASEHRPDERYITFENEEIPYSNIDLTNPRFPKFSIDNSYNNANDFVLDEITGENQSTFERHHSYRMNFELPYGKNNDKFKFGVKLNGKKKSRDNDFFDYSDNFDYNSMNDVTFSDLSISSYNAGDYSSGIFTSKAFLGGLTLSNGERLLEEYIAGNYDAEENISAFYAMITDRLGDKTRIILGARMEATSVDYTGNDYDVDNDTFSSVNGTDDYVNFLPNLTIQHSFSDKFIVNAAYTNTIARPDYFDLTPYRVVIREDEEIEEGNPGLEPTESVNFDLTAEYYFSSVGLISAGFFNKNLSNFTYRYSTNNYTYEGQTGWRYRQTRNGGEATINGIELTFQSKLNFLPGFLSNLSVLSNYTYTDTSSEFVDQERTGLPLVGAVENIFNASLAYESEKLFARLSMHSSDDNLFEVGDNIYEDIYYDAQTFIDLNAAFKVNDKLKIIAEVKNLTDEPLRFYQGLNDRTYQVEFYDLNWNIGLRFEL